MAIVVSCTVIVGLAIQISAVGVVDAVSSSMNIPKLACEVHFKPGDVILGGIFPINRKGSSPCEGEAWTNFISLAESMTYAVDAINKRSDLLPNTALGYEARNDCADEDISLWTMMTMANSQGNSIYEDSCPGSTRGNDDKVSAVIGPGLSSTSLLAAKVGGLFSIPVVSFAATSDNLSDDVRFPFFYRTVPPDKFQVGAIMELLQVYNWRYVALFYSIDTYGIPGARQITTMAEDMDICIAINRPISSEASEEEMAYIADRLIEYEKVSVIIMFSTRPSTLKVLRAIKKFNVTRKFTFIGSDAWGPDNDGIREYEDILIGSMFTRFHRTPSPSFGDYYRELPNNLQLASPWYVRKLDEIAVDNGCVDWNSCTERGPIPEPYYDTQVINAVYVVAYALDASIKLNCQDKVPCSEGVNGAAIEKQLPNVSFYSDANDTFRFSSAGDPSGKYQVSNWQFENGEYKIVDVGLWNPNNAKSRLQMDEDLIQWGTPDGDVPTSLCVEECHNGYITVPLEMNCCFGCERCLDFEIVSTSVWSDDNSSVCVKCPETHWPDVNVTTCLPIYPSYISSKSAVFVLSVITATLGLILTGLTMIAFCYYSDHPLVKSSSRELSPINIIGLALSCVVVLLILARPTTATCIIIDIGISTSYCVIFTPMLLKVNRIWRIFNSVKGTRKPRWTCPRDQVVIASLIIFVEVVIACACSGFTATKPELLFPSQRIQYLEIYCRFGFGFMVSCVYNMIIIVACCYFAFRARKVPSNFNESKFIAVSVYCTVIVTLAAIPVYATSDVVDQQIATLSVVLLVNTFLALACLYLPKLYAINFTDDNSWNIWKTHSGTSNRPPSSDNVLDSIEGGTKSITLDSRSNQSNKL